jgi:hypothetical protein
MAVGSKPRWWRRQRRVKITARLAATECTESKKFKEKLLGGASTVFPGHKRAQCRDPTRCWNGHIATGCPQGQAPKRGRLQPPHSSSLRRTAARAYSPHHLPNHFPELPHSTPVSRSGAWEGATTERFHSSVPFWCLGGRNHGEILGQCFRRPFQECCAGSWSARKIHRVRGNAVNYPGNPRQWLSRLLTPRTRWSSGRSCS